MTKRSATLAMFAVLAVLVPASSSGSEAPTGAVIAPAANAPEAVAVKSSEGYKQYTGPRYEIDRWALTRHGLRCA